MPAGRRLRRASAHRRASGRATRPESWRGWARHFVGLTADTSIWVLAAVDGLIVTMHGHSACKQIVTMGNGVHCARRSRFPQAKEGSKLHPHAASTAKTAPRLAKYLSRVRMCTTFPPIVHMISTGRFRRFALLLIVLVGAGATVYAQAPPAQATLFRVFLLDGSTLVSYGEFARVADQVVLTVPIRTNPPDLQLVSIPASTVDWTKTDAYADSARAARYAATEGPSDYARLGDAVSRALSDISLTSDPERKVAMAIEARKNVTRWLAEHYGYRAADVARMAGLFDDVVADTRRAQGRPNFDLSLVASMAVPPSVPLLPPPDPAESLRDGYAAAMVTRDPAARVSLLRAIRDALTERAVVGGADDPVLRAEVNDSLASEERSDREYATLTRRMLRIAAWDARRASVAALARLPARILQRDDKLGHRRPGEIASLLAAVDAKLDAARRLRLARDQWAARQPLLRAYRHAIDGPLADLRLSRTSLVAIQQMAGPSAAALRIAARRLARGAEGLALVKAPAELDSAQALLTGAMQLAARAVAGRQSAVRSGVMQSARDASSAAAGALLLVRARHGHVERPEQASGHEVITPRTTRLWRAPDLRSFQLTLLDLLPRDPLRRARMRRAGADRRRRRRTAADDSRTPSRTPPRACSPISSRATGSTRACGTALPGAPPRSPPSIARCSCDGAPTRRPPRARSRPSAFARRSVAEMLALYDELRRHNRTVDGFERLLVEALEPGAAYDRGAARLLQQTHFLVETFGRFERAIAEAGALDEHGLRARLLDGAAAPYRQVIVTIGDQAADPHGLWAVDFDLLARMPGLQQLDVLSTEAVLASGFLERVHDWLPGLEERRAGTAAPMPVLAVPESRPDEEPRRWFLERDREEELVAVARALKIRSIGVAPRPAGHRLSAAAAVPLSRPAGLCRCAHPLAGCRRAAARR